MVSSSALSLASSSTSSSSASAPPPNKPSIRKSSPSSVKAEGILSFFLIPSFLAYRAMSASSWSKDPLPATKFCSANILKKCGFVFASFSIFFLFKSGSSSNSFGGVGLSLAFFFNGCSSSSKERERFAPMVFSNSAGLEDTGALIGVFAIFF
ncbi:hypothetical protein BC832DRAFT_562655 [Gaertneriomyces semiglobifer]|nr:hypothetical protein BC832DRAFT_562655 [Gaertneriomyces semiglobifer]